MGAAAPGLAESAPVEYRPDPRRRQAALPRRPQERSYDDPLCTCTLRHQHVPAARTSGAGCGGIAGCCCPAGCGCPARRRSRLELRPGCERDRRFVGAAPRRAVAGAATPGPGQRGAAPAERFAGPPPSMVRHAATSGQLESSAAGNPASLPAGTSASAEAATAASRSRSGRLSEPAAGLSHPAAPVPEPDAPLAALRTRLIRPCPCSPAGGPRPAHFAQSGTRIAYEGSSAQGGPACWQNE
jgi:hypothetical protein